MEEKQSISLIQVLHKGKELRQENLERLSKFNIKEYKDLPEPFKIFFLNVFTKDSVLSKEEFLEFSFSIFYSSLADNEGRGSYNFLQNLKRIKPETVNRKEDIINVFYSVWDKSALNLPLYKINKTNELRHIIKEFSMKDYLIGASYLTMLLNEENIYKNESEKCKFKLSSICFYIFALLYLEEKEKIHKIMSILTKEKMVKSFEICLMDEFESLIRILMSTKGLTPPERESTFKKTFEQIHGENQEKIELLIKDYTKIISELKEQISDLEEENDVLRLELKSLKKEIKKNSSLNKLYKKRIVLIGDTAKKNRYEELFKKYNVRSFVFLDSFDDHSKIVSTAINSDFVFHMTEMSKHNVSNLLAAAKANVILVNKNSISALENAIKKL